MARNFCTRHLLTARDRVPIEIRITRFRRARQEKVSRSRFRGKPWDEVLRIPGVREYPHPWASTEMRESRTTLTAMGESNEKASMSLACRLSFWRVRGGRHRVQLRQSGRAGRHDHPPLSKGGRRGGRQRAEGG